jgi:hemoglobin-like flavoprotein
VLKCPITVETIDATHDK